MKKVLILLVTILITSTSSFGYSVFFTLHNTSTPSYPKQSDYYYYLNSLCFYIELYTFRGEEFVYSAATAAVGAHYEAGGTLFDLSLSSQQQYDYRRFGRFVLVSPTDTYILHIHLYCPQRGDFASAKVNWG